ncbi:hypothetical protein [Actinosynnema sp. NPDC020468]|uniref:hypothetical protein n=1 Tax=Actinosynnema sp. NPDC020468 TaxID=3154488 RepID=UPI0034055386
MIAPGYVVAGVGFVVLVWVWRAWVRRVRAARASIRVRPVSLAGRVVVNAGLIVATQWVVSSRGGGWLLLVVLAVPALFASYALMRALTVTTYEPRRLRR